MGRVRPKNPVTEARHQEVMRLLLSGMTQQEVADMVGYSKMRVCQIANSKRYKWLCERADKKLLEERVDLMPKIYDVFETGVERLMDIVENKKTDPRLVRDIVMQLGAICGYPQIKATSAKVDIREVRMSGKVDGMNLGGGVRGLPGLGEGGVKGDATQKMIETASNPVFGGEGDDGSDVGFDEGVVDGVEVDEGEGGGSDEEDEEVSWSFEELGEEDGNGGVG